MMEDLERQIVSNDANDHQNNGGCERNKDSEGKGRGKSCCRVAVY